jgi:tRNA pseudouridine13 synthase
MLPFRTSLHLSTGGVLKAEPEDFFVEEIPLYPAAGSGEFLFVDVEKRDVSAEELVRSLSRRLDVPRLDIGVAGMKDRRAVTRQRISLPARCEDRLRILRAELERMSEASDTQGPGITILGWERHPHKLRTGHLGGNRFAIRLRRTRPDALEIAHAVAAEIGPSGYPNYFGDQRFGREQETLELGRALLAGAKTPRDIPPARRKFLLRLALSAVQSELFNEVLTRRVVNGSFETVLSGDVLQVRASGGLFVTDDVPREQARLEGGEVSLTGPLFGPKMKQPSDMAAQIEAAVLTASGFTADTFSQFAKLTSGSRRPLGIVPTEFSVTPDDSAEGLIFRFVLPPGAYATTVLREFIKDVGTSPKPSSDVDGVENDVSESE